MRDMTEQAAAQTTARQIACALFCQIDFLSSTEYLWSGIGSIAWNGQNWMGLGSLAQISPVIEDSQLNAQTLSLSLSGIDATLLPEALSEIQQGKPVLLWLAFLNPDGSVVPDPIASYAGRMDQPSIMQDTQTATITLAVENRLADLQRRIERRFSDRDQRLDYPQDNGMGFVSQMLDWNGAWGTTTS